MNNFDAFNIPVDYDSPLSFVTQMADEIAKFTDDGVMKAFVRCGIDIDKDKLVQILQQDKERYSEAYRKGFVEGYKQREDEIVRCKDCKHCGIDSTSYPQYWCSAHTEYHDGDWFCADGEKEGW